MSIVHVGLTANDPDMARRDDQLGNVSIVVARAHEGSFSHESKQASKNLRRRPLT